MYPFSITTLGEKPCIPVITEIIVSFFQSFEKANTVWTEMICTRSSLKD